MERTLNSTNPDNPYSDVRVKSINSYFSKKLNRVVLNQGNDIIHLDIIQLTELMKFLQEVKDGE